MWGGDESPLILSATVLCPELHIDTRQLTSKDGANMEHVYAFNRVHPPLMKDYNGDVYSVPNALLRQTLGTAKWATEKPDTNTRVIRIKGQVIESQFDLTRNIYWTLFIPPEHFAEDIIKTVTIISGVSEIQKHTMERDLEVSASTSGFGLSASVKATLKITDETTREWHKEQKDEREQTFKAGYTYCTWMLVDELILKKTTQVKLGGRPIPRVPTIVTNSEFSCILGTYQDKWKDTESMVIGAEELQLQAAQKESEIRVITLPSGKL
jgi:hypothetical protein